MCIRDSSRTSGVSTTGTLAPPLLMPITFVCGSSEPNHLSRESKSLDPDHGFQTIEAGKEDRDIQGAAGSLATHPSSPRPTRAGLGVDDHQPQAQRE